MARKDPSELSAYVRRISGSAGISSPVLEEMVEGIAKEAMSGRATASLETLSNGDPARTGQKAHRTPQLLAAASSATEKLARGRAEDMTPPEMAAVEAIIIPDKRPAFDIIDGTYFADHPLWGELNEEPVKRRLLDSIPAVGRIELPGQTRIPYGGTGFVVGPGLLMTNRHVAQIFSTGVGQTIRFRNGWRAAVDLRVERGRPDAPDLSVRAVRMIHPWWDMALLEVPELTVSPLALATRDARDLAGRRIAIIGYPARDPLRNDPLVQDELFRRTFGIKRLQPGELGAGERSESFGKMVDAATHDCSTLGGNSGSAVVDLDTGEVLALHFGGRYLRANWAVPTSELARDGRVVDAGVRFAGAVRDRTAPEWLQAWSGLEASGKNNVPGSRSGGIGDSPGAADNGPADNDGPSSRSVASARSRFSFDIPLRVTVELGVPCPVFSPQRQEAPGGGETLERMIEPEHDLDYRGRKGYVPEFLSQHTVPMPLPRDVSVLASLKRGGTVLRYQNFSVLMHAERRLAIVTASNVTKAARLRQPEAGRDYTRKGLGRLGANDSERWFEDERLDSRYQLPDVFFTRDQGAFDKGHLVRREDVAWGRDYASIVRANGDTFHVTNCSPQIAQFNQSARGEDNWGDLENLVLSQAAREELIVFAGPVLDAQDQTFVGRGEDGGALRVQIPSRYWKVVVAAQDQGLAAYGFVLEQDLADVPLEFTVSDNFRRLHLPLTRIEELAGIDFGKKVRDADTWNSEDAQELVQRAGVVSIESLGWPECERITPNVADDEAAEEQGGRRSADIVTEAPNGWRVANALRALRRQVDAAAPSRRKESDGTIGDAAHQTRDSDHNPWVRDGDVGVVTGLDITHDPAGGCDAGGIAAALVHSRDLRLKYVIWNRQIASAASIHGAPSWTWRAYAGNNPHTKHVHVSVQADKQHYDDPSPWSV